MTDELRSVELTRIGPARFKATNDRGGETFFGTGGEDPDFTPVELLLAAIAGCGALDVEAITHKRTTSTTFDVHAEGTQGARRGRQPPDRHAGHLRRGVPRGAGGRRGPRPGAGAIEMSRDRLCTVSRTVQLGEDVATTGVVTARLAPARDGVSRP